MKQTTKLPPYVPILKGRMGEFTALTHVDADDGSVLPLLELVPSGFDEADSGSAQADISKFADRLVHHWGHQNPVMLDAGLFPADLALGSKGEVPIEYAVSQAHSRGVDTIPVVRPSDPLIVRQAVGRLVDQVFGGPASSVCVRLSGDDLDDEQAPVGDVVASLLEQVGVGPLNAHLLVDLGDLPPGRRLLARIVHSVLAEIDSLEDWQTVTVAGGAFPASMTDTQPEMWAQYPRTEWETWVRVTERKLVRTPGFGDYAIASPLAPQGAAFAPPPQIRYTADDYWLIRRGRKNVRRGAAQFFDICAELVDRPEFSGADFSWGDQQIAGAAASAPEGAERRVGPGNATTWRAIGTSHHIAFVVNRLANALGS